MNSGHSEKFYRMQDTAKEMLKKGSTRAEIEEFLGLSHGRLAELVGPAYTKEVAGCQIADTLKGVKKRCPWTHVCENENKGKHKECFSNTKSASRGKSSH